MWRDEGDDVDEAALLAAAAAIGLTLPAETIAGVRLNVALLRQHIARIEIFPLPDDPVP